jgi:protein-tyrosine-phosphatase
VKGEVWLKVLFVCSGNAYRSPVAEALFRKFVPNIEADSAGISPITSISESARRFLSKENAEEHLKEHPESLEQKRLRDYDLIVVMENAHKYTVLMKCPECTDRIQVWDIDDPYFTSPTLEEKIFQQIKAKVIELSRRLNTNSQS